MAQLVKWANTQSVQIQNRIVNQLYRRQTFPELFEKALQANKMEFADTSWYKHLTNFSPRKNRYISIKDSVQLLKKWHNHNGFVMQSYDKGGIEVQSLTSEMDMILSKTRNKINTMVFYGDSNTRKSIVMQSAFEVFPDLAQMYQGIQNNFMFEVLEDCSVCLWEEALFAPGIQETIKQIIGGEETSVSAKYRKNVQIGRVTIGITCNALPWTTILQQEHKTAFENRCIIKRCCVMPHLTEYAQAERINPQAWLHLVPRYWAQKNTSQEEETEDSQEDYFSDHGEADEALCVASETSEIRKQLEDFHTSSLSTIQYAE